MDIRLHKDSPEWCGLAHLFLPKRQRVFLPASGGCAGAEGETVEEAGVLVKFGEHAHRFELFDAAAHGARCGNAVICTHGGEGGGFAGAVDSLCSVYSMMTLTGLDGSRSPKACAPQEPMAAAIRALADAPQTE